MEKHQIIHLFKDAPVKKIIRKPHIIYYVPKDHKELHPEIREIWSNVSPGGIEFVFFDEYIQNVNQNPNSFLDPFIEETIDPCFLTYDDNDDDYYNFSAVIIENENYKDALLSILEILQDKIANHFYERKLPRVLASISRIHTDEIASLGMSLPGYNNPFSHRDRIIKSYFDNSDRYKEQRSELKKALDQLYSQFGNDALEKLLFVANDNQDTEPCSLVIDEKGDFYLEDIKIELNALQKTLYLLFLRHSEGLVLKELQDYYAEALNIYMALKSEKDAFPVGINKATNKFAYARDICKKQRSVFSLIGGGDYQVPEYFKGFTNIEIEERTMSSQLGKNLTTIRKKIIEATKGKVGLGSFYLIEKQGKGRHGIQISSMPDKLKWHQSKRFPTNIFDPTQDNRPYYDD